MTKRPRGYIKRLEGRPIVYVPERDHAYVTIPKKLLRELTSLGVTMPSMVTLTLVLVDDKPEIRLSTFDPMPPKPIPDKPRWSPPEGYNYHEPRGSSSTMNLKRFGVHLYTRQEAEELGLNWDDGR